MSTQDLRRQNAAGDDPTAELLADHVHIGLDAEGYRHHLDRQTETIHRFTVCGRRERRTDLSVQDVPLARALELYIRFVADRVGWDDRRKYTAEDIWGRR